MRVIETSLNEDLSLFSRYLRQQRVAHRIFEERGSQVLEVADPGQGDAVRGAYQAWRSGHLALEAVAQESGTRRASPWAAALVRYPGLTLLVLLACLAFPFSYPLADGELTAVAGWLTIVDLRSIQQTLPGLLEVLAEGQLWRWFTPVFLHFSAAHLAFNCAITIFLGRRLEDALGTAGLWLPVVLIGVASNLAQYVLGDSPVFGGLSGVAYGLVGFVLVMSRRDPDRPE
jgi:GlpG protein